MRITSLAKEIKGFVWLVEWYVQRLFAFLLVPTFKLQIFDFCVDTDLRVNRWDELLSQVDAIYLLTPDMGFNRDTLLNDDETPIKTDSKPMEAVTSGQQKN